MLEEFRENNNSSGIQILDSSDDLLMTLLGKHCLNVPVEANMSLNTIAARCIRQKVRIQVKELYNTFWPL